jgi:hypothetical protein
MTYSPWRDILHREGALGVGRRFGDRLGLLQALLARRLVALLERLRVAGFRLELLLLVRRLLLGFSPLGGGIIRRT